ncbi:MAG: hypothetical protein PVH64_13025 [Bacillota bacterium]|jgi:hypothetical protein
MKKFLDPELAMMIEYLKDKWRAGTDVQVWLKTEFKIDFRDFEEWQKNIITNLACYRLKKLDSQS